LPGLVPLLPGLLPLLPGLVPPLPGLVPLLPGLLPLLPGVVPPLPGVVPPLPALVPLLPATLRLLAGGGLSQLEPSLASSTTFPQDAATRREVSRPVRSFPNSRWTCSAVLRPATRGA
jgi:hypothetical protein